MQITITFIFVVIFNLFATAQFSNVSKIPFQFYQKNYVAAQYANLNQQGKAIFFSFHDHDPRFGNTNFHTHLYENPFEFEKATEQFQSIGLSGQYYLNNRFALNFRMPYKINTRHFKEENPYRLTGFGDLSVGAIYHFYDSELFNKEASFRHITSLQIEGKFKTGKYNTSNMQNDIDPYLQVGTGSFDLSAEVIYNFVFKQLVLKAAFNYYYTGASYYQMKFGHRQSTQLGVEYSFYEKNDFRLTFSGNFNFRQKAKDKIENKDILRPNSFKGLSTEAGILMRKGRYALQINTAFPLYIKYEAKSIAFKNELLLKIFCLIK